MIAVTIAGHSPATSSQKIQVRTLTKLNTQKLEFLFPFSNSDLQLLLGFGLLSDCITQLQFGFSLLTAGWIFSLRIAWNTAELVLPAVISHPVPKAAAHPHGLKLSLYVSL